MDEGKVYGHPGSADHGKYNEFAKRPVLVSEQSPYMDKVKNLLFKRELAFSVKPFLELDRHLRNFLRVKFYY